MNHRKTICGGNWINVFISSLSEIYIVHSIIFLEANLVPRNLIWNLPFLTTTPSIHSLYVRKWGVFSIKLRSPNEFFKGYETWAKFINFQRVSPYIKMMSIWQKPIVKASLKLGRFFFMAGRKLWMLCYCYFLPPKN